MSKILNTISRTLKLFFAVLAVAGACSLMGFVSPAVEYVEKPVHIQVEKERPSLKELVATIPGKYGLSPLLVAAILGQESSGGKMDRIRFEPHHLARVQPLCKGLGADYCRQLASSHGAMQIMGWHAPALHLTWADLYDPATNIEAGCTILRKCMDRHKDKAKLEQVRAALACYNGSDVYAKEVLQRLGDLLIARTL